MLAEVTYGDRREQEPGPVDGKRASADAPDTPRKAP
jgi:hypothetical protein